MTAPQSKGATSQGAIATAARYSFVVSLLWFGFVLSIGFMEAPLKFSAPGLTLPVALGIGHIVFHALTRVETVFAALLLIGLRFGEPTERIRGLFAAAALVVAAQTLLLFTRLDERTMIIIQGGEVEPAPYHWIYIGLDVVKLLLLGTLAWNQIRALETSAAAGPPDLAGEPNPGL